jgi:hypothetical protein
MSVPIRYVVDFIVSRISFADTEGRFSRADLKQG